MFSQPIVNNENECNKQFSFQLLMKNEKSKEIVFENKNKRKTIVKNNNNDKKKNNNNDEKNNNINKKNNNKKNKKKWTEGLGDLKLNDSQSYSSDDNSNASDKNNSKVKPYFSESLNNESLAASLETDFKIKSRKKRLSDLKSNENYRKLSKALDNEESDTETPNPNILHDLSFCSANAILPILTCDCECGINCLKQISLDEGFDNINLSYSYGLISEERKKITLMAKSQVEDIIRDKIKKLAEEPLIKRNITLPTVDSFLSIDHSSAKIDEDVSNFGKYNLHVPLYISNKLYKENKPYKICRTSFCNIYGITSYTFKRLKEEMKLGIINSEKSLHNAKCFNVPMAIAKNIKIKMNKRKEPLTRDQFANMIVPNTTSTAKCLAWMKIHFNANGDFIPNSATDEIHLELITINEIYKEYRRDIKYVYKLDFKDSVSYPTFVKLWDQAYPHVKIRKFKAVTGKCKCCANLSLLRRQSTSMIVRELITHLHSLHRSTVFGEKRSYYDRQTDAACLHPSIKMSLISDGMNKNHSKVPWYGNLCEFSYPLHMHLQCIIEHGKEILIYRTFENVRQDTNLAIHCLLMQLERRKERDGLPEVLFIQYDGGSENANKVTLALCELIVARGLCTEIIVSRLPVGHTHEDCDAIFGIIWKCSRYRHILTPQQYMQIIKNVLANLSSPSEVIDIHCVPDYVKILQPCIDHDIAFLFSGEDTQLQWRFRKVDISPDYPLGVKTEYKLFCQDKAYKIVEQSDPRNVVDIGYIPLLVNNEWFGSYMRSDPTCKNSGILSNIHFLMDLPFEDITPAPFVEGTAKEVKKTLRKFQKSYRGQKYENDRNLMREFCENVLPNNDNVADYICINPENFKIPLLATQLFSELLVNPTKVDNSVQVNKRTFNGREILEVKAAPSVRHSGNKTCILPSALVNMDGSPLYLADELAKNQVAGSVDIPFILSLSPKENLLSVRKLKEILQHYGQSTTGNKKDSLLKRLQSYFKSFDPIEKYSKSTEITNNNNNDNNNNNNNNNKAGGRYANKKKAELYTLLKSMNPKFPISKLSKEMIIDKLNSYDNSNIINESEKTDNNSSESEDSSSDSNSDSTSCQNKIDSITVPNDTDFYDSDNNNSDTSL